MAVGGETERRRGPRRRGEHGRSSDGAVNHGHDRDDEADRRPGIDGEANRGRSRDGVADRGRGRDGDLSEAGSGDLSTVASLLRERWAGMQETMETGRKEETRASSR